MKLEAATRLQAAGTHDAMLSRFDELAKTDTKALKTMVENWANNFSRELESDVTKAFSKGNPDKDALKKLKARLIKLSETR